MPPAGVHGAPGSGLRHCWLLAVLVCVLAAACGGGPVSSPADTVTVQLKWLHQSQFAGFYAADQNGYYKDESISVRFLEGGPGVDRIGPVTSGRAQFAVSDGAACITERASLGSVTCIGVVFRRSPVVYLSLAENGIRKPADFAGKTVETASNDIAFRSMMAIAGLDPSNYKLVSPVRGLDRLYAGTVDIKGGFRTNELLAARASGRSVNVIDPEDFGVYFYGDSILTTDQLIESRPDLVLRFLRATLKGWAYSVENPDATVRLVTRYNPGADLDHETAALEASIPLIATGRDQIGWVRDDVWEGMVDSLVSLGLIERQQDPGFGFDGTFLRRIYGR